MGCIKKEKCGRKPTFQVCEPRRTVVELEQGGTVIIELGWPGGTALNLATPTSHRLVSGHVTAQQRPAGRDYWWRRNRPLFVGVVVPPDSARRSLPNTGLCPDFGAGIDMPETPLPYELWEITVLLLRSMEDIIINYRRETSPALDIHLRPTYKCALALIAHFISAGLFPEPQSLEEDVSCE